MTSLNLHHPNILKTMMFLLVLITSTSSQSNCEESKPYPDKMFPEVLISTTMGDILVELDRNRAPITVNNFLKYIKSGLYNKTIIHRVEENFVIQGGGYDRKFEEISECEKIYNESGNGLRNTKGTIAMARYDDPHSATSSFYFNLTESTSLDPNPKNWGYTVFGTVIEGMDILMSISKVKTGYSDKLQAENVPIEPIIINNVEVK